MLTSADETNSVITGETTLKELEKFLDDHGIILHGLGKYHSIDSKYVCHTSQSNCMISGFVEGKTLLELFQAVAKSCS